MHCSSCDCPLPDTIMRCTHCGEEVILPTITPPEVEVVKDKDHAIATKSRFLWSRSAFCRMLLFFLSAIYKFASQATVNRTWLQPRHDLTPLSIPLTEDGLDSVRLEDEVEVHPDRQMTWRKIVEPPPNRPPAAYPPRPMLPAVVQYVPLSKKRKSRRFSPASIFWGSMTVLLLLVGAFGVTGVRGQRAAFFEQHGPLSLQVTPQEVSVGAMMSLRGANFSPQGPVGLTRDASIPILDTGGASITQSDAQGNFTDTVQVQPNWGSGSHTINAEDAVTHKITSFPIMVSGDTIALRPSHLQLSIDTLDLGSGDPATNTKQTISLTNLGSGQISWQGSSTQSWLMMTPQSGTFYSGTQNKVIIAADRASMRPGSYKAQMLFTSNVGNIPLDVNMQVSPLDPQNKAVLQVTPPVLAFTGNDGGFGPAPQVMTVSNPGVQPLDWVAVSDVPWLSLSNPGGSLQPGDTAQVTVSVDTSRLLPNTYTGRINLSTRGSGAVLHSTQIIDVAVTVTPYCDLLFSSGMLSFTAAYLQPDPPTKTVDLASSLSCPAPLNWNVTSSASWLTVSNWSGTAPSSLYVSVHLDGLAPDTYNGELTFTSSAGTQKLLVSFMLGPPGTPVMSVGSSSLTFNTARGVESPPPQTIRLTNSGARSLFWQASALSLQGGSWLSISPASGSLTAYQSTMLNVALSTTGLTVGTYNGTVVITAVDSVTGQRMGPPQRVAITLNVGPTCTLQAPSLSALQFSTVAGKDPATQTFRVAVTGTCFGDVTVTPIPAIASGSDWLQVSPTSAVLGSGESVTFTVRVASAWLKAGLYSGSISLSAVSDGVVIAASQTVKVTLTDGSGAVLAAKPSSLTFGITTGTSTLPMTISNTTSGTLNWNAALQSGAPTFVSLSANSGTNLAGGQDATVNVSVNATGVASGQYKTGIQINATDAATGLALSTSPITIPVTINVAVPTMKLSATSLSFSTTAGTNPANQTIQLSNASGGTLKWSVGTPSQTWLNVSPSSGTTTAPGGASTLTFAINANGLAASGTPYQARVVITPSSGAAVTVTVTLTVNAASTPTATASTPTPVPTA